MVSVVVRIPNAALVEANAILAGATFTRWVDGWVVEQYEGIRDTETVSNDLWEVRHCDGWITSDRSNGVASLWTVQIQLEVPPPAGQEGPWVESYGPFSTSRSPQNLVITAGGPLVIEHKKGDQKHTLTWNSQHLEDAAAGVPTTYTAVVQVLETSGTVHATSPPITCTMNQPGSWDWYPNFLPELDANWLYVFRVTAEHSPEDGDTDKVDMLTITDFHHRLVWPQHMPPMARIDVDFTLSQASDTVEYDIYDGELSGVVGSGELGSFGAGNHTARVEFPLVLPSPGLCRYTLVLKTKQADGSANRDGRCKPAVPKACSFSFGLSARYVYIYSTGSSGSPGPGHAAAGESWSKGWPYTRVFGWYAPEGWDFDLYGATLGLLKCRTTSGEDPLTTTVEHSGLAHAFEIPPDGSVATRVATYIAQTPTAQEKWEQFLYSGGSADFDGDNGETCKNYDLFNDNGRNCVGFVTDVASLSFTGLTPWGLADDLQDTHANGAMNYVTGWWNSGGLAAHDCSACGQARGDQ